MTNELENEPKLRFPEFNEEWEEKILDEVSTFSKGKGISKNDLSKDGTPCILYGELYTTYDFIINKIKSKTLLDTKNLVKGKKNQVLIPSSGETPLDIATAAVINTTEDMLLGGDINVLTPVQKYDGKFISLSINGKNKSNLSKYAQGKSVVHLYNNDIKKLKIKFPVKNSEQRKIGDFFSKLDRQIELEEQKLEKLEEQKKGYMQQIFSQKLRFKDDNGNYYAEWKEKNLGDISELITKGTTPKNKVNDGSINFIKVENISPINGFITNTTKITEEEHSTYLKRSQLKENDILFSIAGTLGRVSVVKREILPANTNQALAIIRLNAMNLEYIKTYLTGRAIKRFIANNPTVGAQPNMSLTQIRDLIIAVPNLTEQEKIGSFFKKIDNSIKKQSDKIWLLKKRKKGFLQKMFV
ncbi:restriction endonuclease subunit S [Staphylococcus equorum]|uniref:Restriction endonuclease subunit S n=2 Tax=Staphylococcus equorum TaxID=246432 RepID=A0A9X4L613_9STAP|nr:restriction endonuclease subunit S [Staphylococcus equorum]MDG0821100.1 restriction endonuclease subunit S [Staphylococcus equorum]MDG0847416.1 restriction endonuclease subunit S [Staphylococcus equorum]